MAGELWRGTPKRMKKGFPRCGGKPDGGEGGIRTHGPVISRFTRFRVLSPSVTYMVSPVSFSQPCTPANPHEIWAF